MSDSLEITLTSLAEYLAGKAREPKTDLQDSVKIFRELREYHAILTKDDPKGDKDQGRRPTMGGFRARIVSAERNHGGEDEPT